MTFRLTHLIFGLAPIIFVGTSACDYSRNPATSIAPVATSPAPVDQAISEAVRGLLDLAFKAASSIPDKPHIKDRCKTQELVAQACIRLNQPETALRFMDQISDWRRGACYADLAEFCARNGDARNAENYLKTAAAIAGEAEDWRREVINEKIARAEDRLRHARKSAEGAANDDVNALDARIAELEARAASQDLETMNSGLLGLAEIVSLTYDDQARRDALAQTIETGSQRTAAISRVDILTRMAEISLEHHDSESALRWLDKARRGVEAMQWPAEHRFRIASRLLVLRARAGKREEALADAAAELGRFQREKHLIIDIYRAGVLRPLAEAYMAAGDEAAALSVYRMATEEGAVNPNSRPRAEDLAATCASMAISGVTPDPDLSSRLNQILNELGPPW